MNTKHYFPVVLSLVAVLAGCAAEADVPQGAPEADLVAGVKPGTFRLFDEPKHVTDPECESFTDLVLKANNQAELVDGLGGRCALTALMDPNPRSYTLRVRPGRCGEKIYEGSRRVPLGPATTGLATLTITDNRVQTCDTNPPALVVIKESVPASGGVREIVRYSKDGNPTPAEREIIACRELVDHGAEVRFFAARSGAEETITRAEYTETTFVDTQIISNMNVCRALPPEVVGADVMAKTHSCNDVSWLRGYSVSLYQGGIAGIPSIELFQSDASGTPRLVKELTCRYVAR